MSFTALVELFVAGFVAAFVATLYGMWRLSLDAQADRHELTDAHAVRSVTR